MSASSEVEGLVSEAVATLGHAAAIFRLAAMEADEQPLARELWKHAKTLEALAALDFAAKDEG